MEFLFGAAKILIRYKDNINEIDENIIKIINYNKLYTLFLDTFISKASGTGFKYLKS